MNKFRTHNCSELSEKDLNKEIIISGWLHRRRDHGNLIFIDIRDHYGITQCVTENNNKFFSILEKVKPESVLKIKGKVINRSGNPLKGIIIEIWQANSAGKYRDKNDTHDAAIDPNFLGYGVTRTNSKGAYQFKTILPGAYPWGNHKNAWRPKHIHFSIINENIFNRLCTQMYFPNDFLLNYDPIFNSIAKKYRNSLIAKFDNKNNIVPNYLVFTFDIVL